MSLPSVLEQPTSSRGDQISAGRQRAVNSRDKNVGSPDRARDHRRKSEEEFESVLQPLTSDINDRPRPELPDAAANENNTGDGESANEETLATNEGSAAGESPAANASADRSARDVAVSGPVLAQAGMAHPDTQKQSAAGETRRIITSSAGIADAQTTAIQPASAGGAASADSAELGIATQIEPLTAASSPYAESPTLQQAEPASSAPVESADGSAALQIEGASPDGDFVEELPNATDFADAMIDRVAEDLSNALDTGVTTIDTDAAMNQQQESGAFSPSAQAGELTAVSGGSPTTDSRQPLTNQLARAIVEFSRTETADGESTLKLRLDPPELGEVVIRMDRSDERLAVRVEAIEPSTLDMLLARGTELEQQLRKQLDMESLEFSAELMTDLLSGNSSDQDQGRGEHNRPGHDSERAGRTRIQRAALGINGLSFRA